MTHNNKQPTSQQQLISHTQLVSKGKPHFGQFKRVHTINYLDAVVPKTNGKLLSESAKKRKANQFCFVSVNTERYLLACAVINLSLVSNCFVYVYDKKTKQLHEVSKLSPLAFGTTMANTPNEGTISFKQGGFNVVMKAPTSDVLDLTIRSKLVDTDIQIRRSSNPMCLCTRTGYTGWVYMQKETALACTGNMQVKQYKKQQADAVELSADTSFAGIDWTLGYMTRETFWNWSSISTSIAKSCVQNGDVASTDNSDNQHRIGLNLVCGVNDTSFTENSFWLDDTQHNLPSTVFDYNNQDIMQPWHIYSSKQLPSDTHVDLTFTPVSVRSDHTDAGIMASHFNQLIGHYSGTITLGERVITLDNVFGLAEDHYAKW